MLLAGRQILWQNNCIRIGRFESKAKIFAENDFLVIKAIVNEIPEKIDGGGQ